MAYTTNSGSIPEGFNSAQCTSNDVRMKAFDKLPKSVRQALNYSSEQWCPESILRRMKKQKIPARVIVELIHSRSAEYAEIRSMS